MSKESRSFGRVRNAPFVPELSGNVAHTAVRDVAFRNGEGSSPSGNQLGGPVDGRACARLFAKPPNDQGGNGLLQEDGG